MRVHACKTRAKEAVDGTGSDRTAFLLLSPLHKHRQHLPSVKPRVRSRTQNRRSPHSWNLRSSEKKKIPIILVEIIMMLHIVT